jgi:hypothetical protein
MWLQQPPVHAGSSLADFSTLKMEAISFSETSIHTKSTRRHIPEDGILNSYSCIGTRTEVSAAKFSTMKAYGGVGEDEAPYAY